ncbi:MAG: nickel-dependent lactate racemase [Desulfobacula sp.]|jgi:nickel-dependent lactate racemase|uniref:nickel-dependent lactate racemase n=1 Tax=Desulfobacula sp. TaxID=2593537 RepID=UPI001DF39AED|nr:nickel-dependent lactate racemase [Desulfobacula sp.]MBT3485621.1 nickel-dependent lactate racemase [Desulfobacula sp.]MBT3805544.1 nickel-dependent lactate racemase [Desulfobacula sp.]MBT4024793.1 nickel-dependent lactate racemase [Desulfobacula sp.]MBT4200101.1 nickel-dependent lactate racemase [Desulfobacula sp.]
MLKNIEFRYGKGSYAIEVPDKTNTLSIKEPDFQISREKFADKFSLHLPENISDCRAVSIVVADKTRLCDYKTYLPWVLDILFQKGIQKSWIQIFIAYGTHAKQDDEECLKAYGRIYQEYRFIHHDCNDKTLFRYLGKTDHGTMVHVRKDILESDLIITFGALSHHYFAGYGGGRKLLFPGLGYKPDIYHNHGLFLDKSLEKLSPGCWPGNFENNPLAEDLKQIDDVIKNQRLSIHGILNSKGRVTRLIAGNTYNDFLNACKCLDPFYKANINKQYELVIASCGGFPKDINFIQGHKAINNAAMFVKDKGSLIVLAECIDGIGSDAFMEYFNYHDFSMAFDILKKDYKGNGGTALSMMAKTGRIKIFLKTSLDDKICHKIGVTKIKKTRIQNLVKKFQNDMVCIENASLLIR